MIYCYILYYNIYYVEGWLRVLTTTWSSSGL